MSSVTSNGKKKCPSLTKKGKPCRAAPTEGGLCYFHANPSKAVELGRIGGLKNGHPVIADAPDLPKLETVGAVRDALAQMIVDLHRRRLHPSAASGLAQLSNALIRAMQMENVEARLAQMQEKINSILQSLAKDSSKR